MRYGLGSRQTVSAPLGLIDIAYTNSAGAREDLHENWGTDDLESLSRYDGLHAIRINALGAYVLGLAEYWSPETATTAQSITRCCPTTRSSRSRAPLGDRMALSAFADQSAERVWQLTADGLLTASER